MAKTFHKIPTFLHFTLEKFELYQHLGKNILTNTHKELSCLKTELGVKYPTNLVKYLAK